MLIPFKQSEQQNNARTRRASCCGRAEKENDRVKIGEFEVQMIHNDKALDEYEKDGKTAIATPARGEWELRLGVPQHRGRYLLAGAVDGRSIMDGQPAKSDDQHGYILGGGGNSSIDIKGYRLNDNDVAQFKFVKRSKSYSAQMGTPDSVGVIAVVVFSERPRSNYRRGGCFPGAGGGRFSMTSEKGSVGTGFGDRTEQSVTRVQFDVGPEVARFVIEYDTAANLRARGFVKKGEARDVDPFPGDQKDQGPGATPPPGWKDRRSPRKPRNSGGGSWCGTGRRRGR